MLISNIGKKVEQPKSKAKKYVLIGLIVSIVLLLILFILLILLKMIKPTPALTLNVDGEAMQFNSDTFKFTQDNKLYVSLKDVANLVGYRYYDGGYKQNDKSQDTCYLESDDEVVVFELGSDKIYKTLNDGQIQYSEFTISAPVIKDENNKLYVIDSGLIKGCNVYLSHDKSKNIMSINTLPWLYTAYEEKVLSGDYGKINGISVEGMSEEFNNKKAILYNMMVVSSKIKNEIKYGVISLNGEKVHLGIKYNSIEFIEVSQTFLVSEKDASGSIKYTLKTKDGNDQIEKNYDVLKILDSENELYYVQDGTNKGIIDSDGTEIVFGEFDSIYSKIKNGETTCYVVLNKTEIELNSYLESIKKTNTIQQQEIQKVPTAPTPSPSPSPSPSANRHEEDNQENQIDFLSDDESNDII